MHKLYVWFIKHATTNRFWLSNGCKEVEGTLTGVTTYVGGLKLHTTGGDVVWRCTREVAVLCEQCWNQRQAA